MTATSVRLSKEVEEPLDTLSQKLDRSKSYLINQAVKDFIKRQSMEQERWQQTLQALDSVDQGDTVDASDVNGWLDSWGTEDEKTAP